MSTVTVVSNDPTEKLPTTGGTPKEGSEKTPAVEETEKEPAASGAAEEPAEKEENEEAEEGDDEGNRKEEPKKSKGGFQKKIDKLTRTTRDLERELDRLRGENTALKGGNPAATETPAPKKEPAASGEPKEDDYDSHKEYMIALADWRYDQRKKDDDTAAAKKAEKSELDGKVKTYAERKAEFAKAHSDYDDVMEACEAPMSKFVQHYLLKKENGPEIAYHLAKQPELLEKISGMSDADAAEELGVLRASLSAQAKDAPKPKNTTKAPDPITPGGGHSASSSAKTIYEATSFKEFEELEKKRLRAKKGA